MVNLGCIIGCEDIDTLLTATENGTYTLQMGFNGRIHNILKNFTIGQSLVFENTLNECFCYTASLIAPSGAIVETFEFQTKTLTL